MQQLLLNYNYTTAPRFNFNAPPKVKQLDASPKNSWLDVISCNFTLAIKLLNDQLQRIYAMQCSHIHRQMLGVVSVSPLRHLRQLGHLLVRQLEAFVGHVDAACLAECLCQHLVAPDVSSNLVLVAVKVDCFVLGVYPDVSVLRTIISLPCINNDLKNNALCLPFRRCCNCIRPISHLGCSREAC